MTDEPDDPTEIEFNVGGATTRERLPDRFAWVALITTLPADIALAVPPPAIVRTLEFEELHVAVVVKSLVLPSL